jgi:agmatine deiminase
VALLTLPASNLLYFSALLPKRAPSLWEALSRVLQECAIPFRLLNDTRDIWSIDYMPVQVGAEEFVQFRYDPSYLKPKKYAGTITDASKVDAVLTLRQVKQSSLRLDGGNAVRVGNRVVVTDKVFSENPLLTAEEVRQQLEQALQAELIIIPADPRDFTGHADGMVQALDADTVLLNDYQAPDAALSRQITQVLHNSGLQCVPFPYNPYQEQGTTTARGAYINFVRIGPVVLLPVFGLPDDEAALLRASQLFTGCVIVPLDVSELAPDGGLLHCVTWAVYDSRLAPLPPRLSKPVSLYNALEALPGKKEDDGRRQDRYRGAMLGLAFGDAIAGQPATLPPQQATAVTQLALFTAEGLLRAEHRAMLKGIGGAEPQIIWQSWLRWLHTQGVPRESDPNAEWPGGWLTTAPQLQHRRQPAQTTWQVLASGTGLQPRPASNQSMGGDPLARAVPIGLFHFHMLWHATEAAAQVTGYTHGNPVAQTAAGWVAATLAGLARGWALHDAARVATALLPGETAAGAACRQAIQLALRLRTKPVPAQSDDMWAMMRQRSAPAVLLTALYHALQFATEPEQGIRAAAQYGGRQAAALTGAMLGAELGESAWPVGWRGHLDLAQLVCTLADDMHTRVRGGTFHPDEDWWRRYPGW